MKTSEGSWRNRFHISNSRANLSSNQEQTLNHSRLGRLPTLQAVGLLLFKFPLALCDNFLCYHALLTGDTLEIRSKLPAWIVPSKISNTISGFASPAGIYNHCSFLKQWVMKWSDQIKLSRNFFFFFFSLKEKNKTSPKFNIVTAKLKSFLSDQKTRHSLKSRIIFASHTTITFLAWSCQTSI